MSASIHNFEVEIDKLLKNYLGDDNCRKLALSINYSEKEADGISEKINNFYNNQLNIKVDNYNERIKIDRTITFSEKRLEASKFSKFLNELGRVCISSGKLNLASEILKKAKLSCSGLAVTYKAESLTGLANIQIIKGNWKRAIDIITEAKALYKEENDNQGIAVCENLLGTINGELGDIESAKQHFQTSLSLIDPEKDLEIAAGLQTNLSIIEHMEGNLDNALRLLEEAQKKFKELQDFKNYALTSHSLGTFHFEVEDYSSAISSIDEGLEIAKQHNFLSILCMLYVAKARVLISVKAFYYALEFTDKALEISHHANNKITLAEIYKLKGIIERELKNFDIAESFFLNSIRINNALRNEMNTAETYVELGILYRELNNSDSKQSSFKNALNYYKKIKSSIKIKKIENLLNYQDV